MSSSPLGSCPFEADFLLEEIKVLDTHPTMDKDMGQSQGLAV
jgi:hypothetical protein